MSLRFIAVFVAEKGESRTLTRQGLVTTKAEAIIWATLWATLPFSQPRKLQDFSLKSAWCARRESNSDLRFRRPS